MILWPDHPSKSSQVATTSPPSLLGRGEKYGANLPPATISREKGILQKLKEVFWKPEDEVEDERSEGQRQKMS